MPSRKSASKAIEPLASSAQTVVSKAKRPTSSSIPSPLKFPLVVTSSLILSSVFYSVAAQYTAGDLGSVSRKQENWWEVSALIAWRATELAIGWWSDFDGVDLASLTLLTHLPPLYLLLNFYSIRPSTVVTSLLIDLLATYIPFRLLRPLSSSHTSPLSSSPTATPPAIDSLPIRALTTTLASAIYSTLLLLSYHTFLPIHLVTHFDGIRSLAAAHAPSLPWLFLTSLPVGYAARVFLFSPVAHTPASGAVRVTALELEDLATDADIDLEIVEPFDASTATLAETLRYNLWGWDARTKQLAVRTATLVGVTAVNTWVQLWMTVEGVEWWGAVGYAGLWAVGGLAAGGVLGWVGDV